jgi:glyoxylase-like metal-dependent hydrolase (beta-lactamase superfamily II)
MKIICIPNRPMGVNTYIIYDETSLAAVLIDPSFETDKITAKINNNGIRVTDILLTHGHFDHIYNIPVIKENTGASIWTHEAENAVITCSTANGSLEFCDAPFTVTPDEFFTEGEYTFNGLDIRVIHTPGHTAGSSCFFIPRADGYVLLTGDTLFNGGIGRSDFATGDGGALLNSIKYKIFTLPDETVIMPGHGGKTTVAHEREHNPYI